MDNKNIKKLVGSVSLSELVDGVLGATNNKTVGDFYDAHVSCARCHFQNKCETLATYLEEQGKNPSCAQLISIMIGESKLTDIE